MKTIPTSDTEIQTISESTLAKLPDWMRLTSSHVAATNFGQVTLTIHQGDVVEIQKTERTRFSHRKC